jgi:Uma2 family endonuclease
MAPSGSFSHGAINGNIYRILWRQLLKSKCFVSMENLDLHIGEDYLIPDVMLICDRDRVKNGKYSGVPRLVVETISRSTLMRDRTVKKDKYESIGVDEYWIVSPEGMSIEIYYLENGRYVLHDAVMLEKYEDEETYNGDTEITLRSNPEIKLKLKDIFDDIF